MDRIRDTLVGEADSEGIVWSVGDDACECDAHVGIEVDKVSIALGTLTLAKIAIPCGSPLPDLRQMYWSMIP